MIRNIFAACLAIVMGIGCAPADIEYPSLSAVINSRSIEIGELGIKEFSREEKKIGFGYTEFRLKSDICAGDYSIAVPNLFDFHATLNGDKWSAYAAPDLMAEISKDEASKTLALALDEMIESCKKAYHNKRSWQ